MEVIWPWSIIEVSWGPFIEIPRARRRVIKPAWWSIWWRRPVIEIPWPVAESARRGSVVEIIWPEVWSWSIIEVSWRPVVEISRWAVWWSIKSVIWAVVEVIRSKTGSIVPPSVWSVIESVWTIVESAWSVIKSIWWSIVEPPHSVVGTTLETIWSIVLPAPVGPVESARIIESVRAAIWAVIAKITVIVTVTIVVEAISSRRWFVIRSVVWKIFVIVIICFAWSVICVIVAKFTLVWLVILLKYFVPIHIVRDITRRVSSVK
ncbi:hypothetical protein TRFO_08682 [Tritrichomonas foetus]|uniref:Uncharacterized protein n=1 Tax=Tritrichomonas foetus TaxID=1144522 RepID=A0A1J4JHS0_9EUKA|nr:hypothetical protein TRFO_08682 [Tritrichomonas foetus]|eukprot:OHS98706.1 hypothetical protein TRFO_08682 [Tritrichomonas foetus]